MGEVSEHPELPGIGPFLSRRAARLGEDDIPMVPAGVPRGTKLDG